MIQSGIGKTNDVGKIENLALCREMSKLAFGIEGNVVGNRENMNNQDFYKLMSAIRVYIFLVNFRVDQYYSVNLQGVFFSNVTCSTMNNFAHIGPRALKRAPCERARLEILHPGEFGPGRANFLKNMSNF